MILTTIKSGLHWSAHTPSGQFEQRIRNEQRIRRWRKKLQTRSGNTPTSSDAADPSSRPSGWEVFSDIACALLFVVIVLLGAAAAWAIHAVAVEPETRCFSNALGETYCRTQRDWGDK